MNKTLIKVYCSKEKKEEINKLAKERDTSMTHLILSILERRKLPPTRLDCEIAAKLLDCLPLLDKIDAADTSSQELTNTIRKTIELTVKTIYKIYPNDY